MGYTARHETIDHIAALVWQERPEWDESLIKIVLHSHASIVDGTDLTIAALRCAQNRDYPTPKAIGWRGPHWRGLDTMPLEVRFPDTCTTCGKPEPRCYSERPGPRTGPNADDHRFIPKVRVSA